MYLTTRHVELWPCPIIIFFLFLFSAFVCLSRPASSRRPLTSNMGLLSEESMEFLEQCRRSRRLVLIIVAIALLLDNMLLTTVGKNFKSYQSRIWQDKNGIEIWEFEWTVDNCSRPKNITLVAVDLFCHRIIFQMKLTFQRSRVLKWDAIVEMMDR